MAVACPAGGATRGHVCGEAHLMTCALGGAKVEPVPAAFVNLGLAMQPAGTVSFSHEGGRR